MAEIFRKKSAIKLPQRSRSAENEEYVRERKGVLVCKRCKNVRFRKAWHERGSNPKEELRLAQKRGVYWTLCPSCRMILDNLYEGEIIVEGLLKELAPEFLNLVKAFGKRALERDPQHRIIEAVKTKRGYRITTTENQLAVKLAKKIKDVFNKIKVEIIHSEEPYEVGRIRVRFL